MILPRRAVLAATTRTLAVADGPRVLRAALDIIERTQG